MAASLTVRPNRTIFDRNPGGYAWARPLAQRRDGVAQMGKPKNDSCWGVVLYSRRPLARTAMVALAGSRADDSAPFEMSVENALKLLGVSEGASFDEILRAKNLTVAACKDDQEAIAQVLLLELFSLDYQSFASLQRFLHSIKLCLHSSLSM